MFAALDTLIHLLFYSMAGVGAVVLFQNAWTSAYQGVRRLYYGVNQRRFIRVSSGFLSQSKLKVSEQGAFVVQRHLEDLLQATMRNKRAQNVTTFVYFSIVFGFVVYLLLVSVSRNFVLALVPALLAIITPYVVLLIKHHHIGIRNSYEFKQVIEILLPQYRKLNGSMVHALTETVSIMPNTPLRRALGRLTNRLSNYATPQDARDALGRFVTQVGTSWAVQLCNDIEHAIIDGVNVEESLSVLHQEFKDIEDAMKGSRLVRMDSLLVATSPFFVWPLMMAFFYFKVSRNIFTFQFRTATGLQWFELTLICTFGSFLVGIIFYRPKQDI